MCWVMPPASPAATLVLRIASSSDVLPWSTWPMTVTTGGRGSSFDSSSATSRDVLLDLEARLLDRVAELAGEERGGVGVDQLVDVSPSCPGLHQLRMRSAALTPMRCDSSETVIASSIRMIFLCSAFSVICVFAPFLVGFFFLPRIGMYARSVIAACQQLLAR